MKPTENTHTTSKAEMHHAAELESEVSKELQAGFKFLANHPQSVTFFGSSQFTEDNKYCQDARVLAGKIVKEINYSVFTGGGPGIMEAANRGAFEAGGHSLGITIDIPAGQIINKYLTDQINMFYFFIRKVCLTFSAEAFIFYPGGLGTLDEFFEIVTLVQTKKIEGVPIICVGSDYWNALRDFMNKELRSRGSLDDSDLQLFNITDDHDEVIRLIKSSASKGHPRPTA